MYIKLKTPNLYRLKQLLTLIVVVVLLVFTIYDYYLVGISFTEKCGIFITQEEMDRHNKEEGKGRWLVINGKIYDIEPLAMQVHCYLYNCTHSP